MSIYSSSIRDLTYKFDYAKHPFRLSLKKKKKQIYRWIQNN